MLEAAVARHDVRVGDAVLFVFAAFMPVVRCRAVRAVISLRLFDGLELRRGGSCLFVDVVGAVLTAASGPLMVAFLAVVV